MTHWTQNDHAKLKILCLLNEHMVVM